MGTTEEFIRRLEVAEADVRGLKRKGWMEIVAIPLAIAVTGIVSTWFVTQAQLASGEKIAAASVDNASKTAAASLAAAERSALSQERLKALELHIKYIADRDPRVRDSGVRLLAVIEPELANKLREQVIATDSDPNVRARAEQVAISGWFPVVASKYDLQEARQAALALNKKGIQYPVHVYRGTDDKGKAVFAITLGGYLSRSESGERVTYARGTGIAADAFALQHANWGQNLLE
jgi:hypothetical protein